LHSAARRFIKSCLKDIEPILSCDGKNRQNWSKMLQAHKKMSRNGAYISTKIGHKPYLGELRQIERGAWIHDHSMQ